MDDFERDSCMECEQWNCRVCQVRIKAYEEWCSDE